MGWIAAVAAYGLTTSTALLLINSGTQPATTLQARRLLGVPLSPLFLLGVCTYGVSLLLWLYVAANASPVVAYGSAVASASLWLTGITLLLHRAWTPSQMLGLILVVAGAVLLRRPA